MKTILGKADDSLLPAASVDAVLLLKTYHEVAQPVALLRNLRAGRCVRAPRWELSTATEMEKTTESEATL